MSKHTFRQYHTRKRDDSVRRHYESLRRGQTVAHVQRMLQKHCTRFTKPLSVWEAFDAIADANFIDTSDPDLPHLSNDHHALQTAEGLRAAGEPEWLQLVGLLHDLGKVLFVHGCDQDGTSAKTQWSVTGDTFLVGCAIPDTVVYPEYNVLNPDWHDSRYNTKLGTCTAHGGLDQCMASFGHDEYLYRVLQHNRTEAWTLPEEAYYVIRWHSLYPWHQHEAYAHLANDLDRARLPLLRTFSHYDLYTKDAHAPLMTSEKRKTLRTYYTGLLQRYLGETTTLYW